MPDQRRYDGEAWLVSFKLTGIGPFFIVLGAVCPSHSSAGDRQSRVLLRADLLRPGPHLEQLKPLQNQWP
jgi:hypothetical protein